jgi:hypothetical protein
VGPMVPLVREGHLLSVLPRAARQGHEGLRRAVGAANATRRKDFAPRSIAGRPPGKEMSGSLGIGVRAAPSVVEVSVGAATVRQVSEYQYYEFAAIDRPLDGHVVRERASRRASPQAVADGPPRPGWSLMNLCEARQQRCRGLITGNVRLAAITCRRTGRDEDDNDRLIRRAAVGRAAVSATVLAMLASGCGGAKLR